MKKKYITDLKHENEMKNLVYYRLKTWKRNEKTKWLKTWKRNEKLSILQT